MGLNPFRPFGMKRRTKKNIEALVVLGLIFGIPFILSLVGLYIAVALKLLGVEAPQ